MKKKESQEKGEKESKTIIGKIFGKKQAPTKEEEAAQKSQYDDKPISPRTTTSNQDKSPRSSKDDNKVKPLTPRQTQATTPRQDETKPTPTVPEQDQKTAPSQTSGPPTLQSKQEEASGKAAKDKSKESKKDAVKKEEKEVKKESKKEVKEAKKETKENKKEVKEAKKEKGSKKEKDSRKEATKKEPSKKEAKKEVEEIKKATEKEVGKHVEGTPSTNTNATPQTKETPSEKQGTTSIDDSEGATTTERSEEQQEAVEVFATFAQRHKIERKKSRYFDPTMIRDAKAGVALGPRALKTDAARPRKQKADASKTTEKEPEVGNEETPNANEAKVVQQGNTMEETSNSVKEGEKTQPMAQEASTQAEKPDQVLAEKEPSTQAQDLVVKEAVTQEVPTQEVPTQEVLTQEAHGADTHGVATQDAATQDAVTQDEATQDEATQDEATQDEATQDAALQDAATQDAATKHAAMQDAATQQVIVQTEATHHTVTQETPAQAAPVKDAPAQDAPIQESEPQPSKTDKAEEESAPEDPSVSQEALSPEAMHAAAQDATAPQETLVQTVVLSEEANTQDEIPHQQQEEPPSQEVPSEMAQTPVDALPEQNQTQESEPSQEALIPVITPQEGAQVHLQEQPVQGKEASTLEEKQERQEGAPTQEVATQEVATQEVATQEVATQEVATQEMVAQEGQDASQETKDSVGQEALTQEEQEALLQEASTQDSSTQETLIQEVPTQGASTQETPAHEALILEEARNEAPTSETSIQQASTQEAPTREEPAHEAPAHEPPTQEASTEVPPAHETSTHETPKQEESETAVREPPATQESALQEAPTHDAPTHDVPMHEAPKQEISIPEAAATTKKVEFKPTAARPILKKEISSSLFERSRDRDFLKKEMSMFDAGSFGKKEAPRPHPEEPSKERPKLGPSDTLAPKRSKASPKALRRMMSMPAFSKKVAPIKKPIKAKETLVSSKFDTDWEKDTQKRWNEFFLNYKRKLLQPPNVEVPQQVVQKRNEDAAVFIGALKKLDKPPPPPPPPVAPPPPPISPVAALQNQGVVNMFNFGEVDIDFTEFFGANDDDDVPLRVWIVKNYGESLEPIAEELFGCFNTNLTYLILQTAPAQKAKEHIIHTWLGTGAMRQRRSAGSTALLAVQLRTHLGSSVKKLVRNEEGSEEDDFYAAFAATGVSYEDELDDTPAKELQHGPVLNRAFYHVLKTPPTRRAAYSIRSLKSDCVYVLVNQEEGRIDQWNGADANLRQKLRSRKLCVRLRAYFNEKLEIDEFGEYEEPKRFLEGFPDFTPQFYEARAPEKARRDADAAAVLVAEMAAAVAKQRAIEASSAAAVAAVNAAQAALAVQSGEPTTTEGQKTVAADRTEPEAKPADLAPKKTKSENSEDAAETTESERTDEPSKALEAQTVPEPTEDESIETEPTEAEPTEVEPTETEPTEVEPTETEPTESHSTGAEPIEPLSTEAETSKSESIKAKSTEPESVAESSEAEPTEGAQNEAVEAEADPIETPVHELSTEAEPTTSEPATPRSAAYEDEGDTDKEKVDEDADEEGDEKSNEDEGDEANEDEVGEDGANEGEEGELNEDALDEGFEEQLEDELYVVSMHTIIANASNGKLELKNVEATPPYKYSLISNSDDVFILDCTSDIFVWYGPKSAKNKKKKATGRDCAHLFFQNYERPSWAKVWEISAGSEPPFFAEHFSNWPEPVFTKFGARQDRGFIIPKSKQPPPPKLWEWDYVPYFRASPYSFSSTASPRAERHHLCVEAWAFSPIHLKFIRLVDPDKFHFYRKDSSLILATWVEEYEQKAAMYWWQGSQAAGLAWKQFVFGMKNILTSKIASQGFPKPECIVIQEHKETLEFADFFGGIIVIHMGSRFYKEQNTGDKLYSLQQTSDFTSHIVQVPLEPASLSSKGVFLLLTGTEPNQNVTIWRGSHSVTFNLENIVKFLVNIEDQTRITVAQEGNEPTTFWAAFNNTDVIDYPLTDSEFAAKYNRIASLYKLFFSEGKFQVTQIPHPIYANDFEPTSIYVLETGHELYVWTGTQLCGGIEDQAKKWVHGYKEFAKEKHDLDLALESVPAFAEPPQFTRHFHAWFRPQIKQLEKPVF